MPHLRPTPPAPIWTKIRAGKFPPAEANGARYLMIPMTLKGRADEVV